MFSYRSCLQKKWSDCDYVTSTGTIIPDKQILQNIRKSILCL